MSEKRKISQSITFASIPLDSIMFDTNIRSEYKDEDINELSESMKIYGQLQNIRVYKKEQKYRVIFGHRRYLAAKKVGLANILADVVSEPESIDKIYLQAIENEQSKSLTPEDREEYIHSLLEMGESFSKIAKTTGKSESWVRECDAAYLVRSKYKALLECTGITFTTKELNDLRNATDEQVGTAVALAVENPENKRDIFAEVNKSTKKKMNVGGKRKNKENIISSSGDIKISFGINLEEEKRTFSIIKGKNANIDEALENSLKEVIVKFYTGKGYLGITAIEKEDSTEWNRQGEDAEKTND